MVSPTRWVAVALGGLGIWLMAAPFVLGAPMVDTWNDVIVGGALSLLAGHNYASEREQGKPSQWIAGILILLGVWLFFVPFLVGVSGLLLWNDVVVAVLVTALAGYSAYAAQLIEQTRHHTPTDEL
ncbi:SPW repeat-containing protein [Halopelagius inordinatus]|uniref:SPW repeat-containing protein n=2 Tax=Halopelagius inordinatus TaxID=553467 RepID=A0A1I2W4B4_9EURY|nr:SPW repeat-containing protein [Halopelagius inordinatus]